MVTKILLKTALMILYLILLLLVGISATRAKNLGERAKAKNFLCLEYIFALDVAILPIFGGIRVLGRLIKSMLIPTNDEIFTKTFYIIPT